MNDVEKPKRICPSCQIPLDIWMQKDKYGLALELDRCPECRGIYFDKHEALRLNSESKDNFLQEIDSPPVSQTMQLEDPICPGCKTKMSRLEERSWPETLHASRCDKCEGMWLSESDILEFMTFREKRLVQIRAKSQKAKNVKLKYKASAFFVTPHRPEPKDAAKELTSTVVQTVAHAVLPRWASIALDVLTVVAPGAYKEAKKWKRILDK